MLKILILVRVPAMCLLCVPGEGAGMEWHIFRIKGADTKTKKHGADGSLLKTITKYKLSSQQLQAAFTDRLKRADYGRTWRMAVKKKNKNKTRRRQRKRQKR